MRRACALVVLLAALSACSAAAPTPAHRNATGAAGDNGSDATGTFGTNGNGSGTGVCTPAKGNYDVPGNGCDDDGDGTVDNPPICDKDAIGATTAEAFARAMGICARADADGYGLVSAKFTRGYQRNDPPNDAQHGVLGKFGDVIRSREGAALGVLSSGYAQEFDGPGNASFGLSGGGYNQGPSGVDWFGAKQNAGNGSAPPGFPKAAQGCRQDSHVNDVVDLVLELTAPPNVSGLAFDFDFYSGEWPAYICTEYNDGFVAYLSAQGFNGGAPDNISFDKDKNPVSVNNGFFDRCTAGAQIGCAGQSPSTSQCPGGTSELGGTGFGTVGPWCSDFDGSNGTSVNGGATGWLSSSATVTPGETFTLELMIWDAGDGWLDSSVLVDNFRWLAGKVTTGTVRPPH